MPHAVREIPEDQAQNFVAGFDEVAKRRFHARRSGAGNCAGDLIGGFENAPKHRADVAHDGQKFRVEMAERVGAHRAKRFGIRSRRPRAHQDARWDFDFGNGRDVEGFDMRHAVHGRRGVTV